MDNPQTAIIPNEARLYGKMAKVMSLVNRVPKGGENKFHNYKYASADDVADTIREAMATANLALIVQMGEVKQETIEYQSSNKTTRTLRTTVNFNFIFACGDTGAVVISPWTSQVDDNSDKAINKCATSAEKYFLMKTFIVSAGDEPDPDADKHIEAPAQKIIPPKWARDCFNDAACRREFADFRANLGITDDAPYLAALKISRYSEYTGKMIELYSDMTDIHDALNQPTPDPVDDIEPAPEPEPEPDPVAEAAAQITVDDTKNLLNTQTGSSTRKPAEPAITDTPERAITATDSPFANPTTATSNGGTAVTGATSASASNDDIPPDPINPHFKKRPNGAANTMLPGTPTIHD